MQLTIEPVASLLFCDKTQYLSTNHRHPTTMSMHPTVYCLTGFGLGTAPMQPLLDALAQRGMATQWLPLPAHAPLENYLTHTAATIRPQDVVLGWSLGGQIATLLAHKASCRLVCLASNPRFVADLDWQHGMARDTFSTFVAQQQRHPLANLHQFAALCALQDAVATTRQWVKQFRANLMEPDASAAECHLWHLQLLAQLDTRDSLRTLTMPQLHMFAQNDALVPVAAAQALRSLLHGTDSRIEHIAGASHLLPLGHAEACATHIAHFLHPHTAQ